MEATTAAHVDKSTLVVSVYDPQHAQRVTTELFTRTRLEILKNETLCWLCGNPASVVGPLELHHCNIERMFAEIIDWELVKAAALAGELGCTHNQREENKNWDWDGFLAKVAADPMACYDYVDDMHLNGQPLCVLPDVPVLMADGSQKAIQDVRAGDQVIGHDLKAHRVLSTMSRRVAEHAYEFGSVALTGIHPVWTPDGWVPIRQSRVHEVYQVGVMGTQMVGLTGEQFEVLDAVVGLDLVSVMNAFLRGQTTAQVLLHHIDMLEKGATLVTLPDVAAHVSLRRHTVTGHEPRTPLAGACIERRQPAGIRAKPGALLSFAPVEHDSAELTFDAPWALQQVGFNSHAVAGLAASHVAGREVRVDEKNSATNSTVFGDTASALYGRWRSVGKLKRTFHAGSVYDIEVEDSHSFIAGGIAVHNCKPHHTGVDEGIHSMDYPRYQAQRFALAGYKFSDVETLDSEQARIAAIDEDDICPSPADANSTAVDPASINGDSSVQNTTANLQNTDGNMTPPTSRPGGID